ncbi:FAD binding domain-containing protein [Bacillus niameyensis]|uniref:FAD binding domain-containing protein n=1 Tax=Bacillus niameyensis TaxID=1522308 RepID=UPI000780DD10|nr:FAD binding domain-containing protein [Bacillus niameyensis]
MIPFDFEYYQPDSIEEALDVFQKSTESGEKALFISGGTEFITFARINQLQADAIIDVKGIPECHSLLKDGERIRIGAAVSLNLITDSCIFPLMGEKVRRIADRTSRNKITIGGNVNSQLIYREGVLPLLLADAKVSIAGHEQKIASIESVFEQKFRLEPGQFLVDFQLDASFTECPFFSLKKTKQSRVGYPIVSLAALVKDGSLRVALSGVCEYPFRSKELEAVLNDLTLSAGERVVKASTLLPAPIIDDLQASKDYRHFLLKQCLEETIEALELVI